MNFNKYFLSERSPYLGEPQYNIAPLIGAALISGGTGLLSGLLNNKSTSNTNAANLANTNAYNETQLQIAKMNNDFNYKMWQENNAYNTPEQQMQRYRDAGINPYMALGQMNAGNAESGITASVPTMSAPPSMQSKDYSYVGNTVAAASQVALNSADAIKSATQAKGQAIQNEFDSSSLVDRINKMHYDSKISEYGAALSQGNLSLFKDTYKQQVQLADLSVKDATQQILESQERIAKMRAEQDLLDMQKYLTMSQTQKINYYLHNVAPVELSNLRKQGKLLDQQSLSEIAKRALMRSQIDLNEANETSIMNVLQYTVQGMALDNQIKGVNLGIATDTYGAVVGKSYSDWYKSGFYQVDNNDNIGLSAGKYGTFGFGYQKKQTKNFLYDQSYYDKQGNMRGYVQRGQDFSHPPTIKIKHKRYKGTKW